MTTTIEKNRNERSGWKLLAAGLALAALSGTAAARDNVSFSITLGSPAPVYAPAPAYIYERPVYYSAPPVFYSAPPVVYAPPRVVYYAAPAYPSRHGRGHGHGHGHGHGKHWHKHHGHR